MAVYLRLFTRLILLQALRPILDIESVETLKSTLFPGADVYGKLGMSMYWSLDSAVCVVQSIEDAIVKLPKIATCRHVTSVSPLILAKFRESYECTTANDAFTERIDAICTTDGQDTRIFKQSVCRICHVLKRSIYTAMKPVRLLRTMAIISISY